MAGTTVRTMSGAGSLLLVTERTRMKVTTAAVRRPRPAYTAGEYVLREGMAGWLSGAGATLVGAGAAGAVTSGSGMVASTAGADGTGRPGVPGAAAGLPFTGAAPGSLAGTTPSGSKGGMAVSSVNGFCGVPMGGGATSSCPPAATLSLSGRARPNSFGVSWRGGAVGSDAGGN